MHFDSLEEKCLYYRSLADHKIMPNSNVIAMVDGRAFSRLIKKRFSLPFDNSFIKMMDETAKYVCENVQGCKLAYVQSDEISFLITDYDTPESDSFFGYRLCKMQSIIASLATAKFNQMFVKYIFNNNEFACDNPLETIDKIPLAQFDCKVWPVPNGNDAFAWFLYRQIDCTRNSKQQTAQTYLPHKELLNKNVDEQLELLKSTKGIDWNDYSDGKKYGRFVYRVEHQIIKEVNGVNVDVNRKKWEVNDAFQLTGPEGKPRFFDILPILTERN